MKKISAVLPAAVILLAGCRVQNPQPDYYAVSAGVDDTAYLRDVDGCPRVHIREHDTRVIQRSDYMDLFEVKAAGYDGYCYFNENINKNRAVVRPKFRIRRLSPGDVSHVDFSYYLETVEGPAAYLGRKTYFASASIPEGVEEIYYSAPAGELTIPPPGTYNLDIYLGMSADRYDQEYKK